MVIAVQVVCLIDKFQIPIEKYNKFTFCYCELNFGLWFINNIEIKYKNFRAKSKSKFIFNFVSRFIDRKEINVSFFYLDYSFNPTGQHPIVPCIGYRRGRQPFTYKEPF